MAKKQFKSTVNPLSAQPASGSEAMKIDVVQMPPPRTEVEFGENAASIRRFNFFEYYGHGCDEVVYSCQQSIERLVDGSRKTHGQTLSMATIAHYCQSGLIHFLPFCAVWAGVLVREFTLGDLDRSLIQRFIQQLASQDLKPITQKSIYTRTKSVLMDLCRHGLISRDIFPRNPYPNSNRQTKGQRSLSKEERAQVVKTLGIELRRIAKEEGPLSSHDLGIFALGIAARTGLNPTPLLQLSVDCLQPHPLKASHRLLVSYKRRGNNTHIQSIRKSEDVELLQPVKSTEVTGIIDAVATRNAAIRQASAYPQTLFVYESRAKSNAGEKRPLSKGMLRRVVDHLVSTHNIIDDDGDPLQLNVMRLRKTFSNRMWELSDGDPFTSAAITGHGIKVQNDHYLEAPPDAEKNWRMMGEVLVESLLEPGSTAAVRKENTPVAGCSDNLYGDRAPKNGSHCVNFLGCFICKNFVVTGDDLYRVYSFYWLLVRERKRIGARRWSRYYAHIIRIIDKQIAPQFDAEAVAAARQKAKTDPHPFWRDPQILETSA